MVKRQFEGVFAPIVTPFDEKGNISYGDLKENIEKLNPSNLRGYLVLGTNGEYKSLSETERMEVLETVISVAGEDKVVMAGTGHESTVQSITETKKAAAAGAHFASLLCPSFFAKRMTDQVLLKHFSLIADASPIPVLLYNNPSVAVVTYSTKLVAEISVHPKVVGMKDSSKGNFASYLLAAAPGFILMAGSANFFLEALVMGGTGGVLSIANFAPDFCCRVYELWKEGRFEEARTAQYNLMALNQNISGRNGVAGVKAAMNLAGFAGGLPRLPLLPVSASEEKMIREALIESGLIQG